MYFYVQNYKMKWKIKGRGYFYLPQVEGTGFLLQSLIAFGMVHAAQNDVDYIFLKVLTEMTPYL